MVILVKSVMYGFESCLYPKVHIAYDHDNILGNLDKSLKNGFNVAFCGN